MDSGPSLGHKVASSAILNASVNVSAAVAVQTGSLLGGYFSIEGSGAITKAGSNDCTPLVAVNNNTGGGVDNVFVAMQNGTGTTVTEIVKVVSEHGAATHGVHIADSTGTITNGLSLSGTITNGFNIAAAATITNLFKFDAIAGCVLGVDVNPKDVPSGGGLGADACIKIDIGGADYFIPIFAVELS